MSKLESLVLLDLNSPLFQENLFSLPKPERHFAVETLKKIRQLSWPQLYGDRGLKWEKITSAAPPAGIDAVYSLCACRNPGGPRLTEMAIT
jgi:hypothetical protein